MADTTSATAVGKRIRRARRRAGFGSLRALALVADVPESYLSKYENGKHLPSAPALLAIARACGVSTDWLLQGGKHSTIVQPEPKGSEVRS